MGLRPTDGDEDLFAFWVARASACSDGFSRRTAGLFFGGAVSARFSHRCNGGDVLTIWLRQTTRSNPV
jgi:hypothetical protein